MDKVLDITGKRWFMGKGSKVNSVDTIDLANIAGNAIRIVRVSFEASEKRAPDLYVTIDDENRIGEFFHEVFTSGKDTIPAQKGYFSFERTKDFPANLAPNSFLLLKPFDAEQSNSAFTSKRFFFKLYRRLQPGIHPEAEIMKHLGEANFYGSPRLYGTCYYTDAEGKRYTFGILEKNCPGGIDSWKKFNQSMDPDLASALGKATATMHRLLAKIPGEPSQAEEIPFRQLRAQLQNAISTDKFTFKEMAQELLDALPALERKATEAFAPASSEEPLFKPQRIHGDYHLGQVLAFTGNKNKRPYTVPKFKILDFEGEPSRTLEYRRALRSPAVDIAGMLRSFQYASAASGLDSAACERAFLEGYARTAHVDVEALETACTPYVLAKAVYEACYELEFRPGWFPIPARALLEFARP